MNKQLILEAYRDGSPIGLIKESFSLTEEEIKTCLEEFKNKNRLSRTFEDDFKKVIAERDINGIPRRQIALELNINVNTVKKACEQFGQTFKERASSENVYTRIDGVFDKSTCPSCSSKKVNEVEENVTYCKDCGSEHTFYKDHVLKLNWEYLEE